MHYCPECKQILSLVLEFYYIQYPFELASKLSCFILIRPFCTRRSTGIRFEGDARNTVSWVLFDTADVCTVNRSVSVWDLAMSQSNKLCSLPYLIKEVYSEINQYPIFETTWKSQTRTSTNALKVGEWELSKKNNVANTIFMHYKWRRCRCLSVYLEVSFNIEFTNCTAKPCCFQRAEKMYSFNLIDHFADYQSDSLFKTPSTF